MPIPLDSIPLLPSILNKPVLTRSVLEKVTAQAIRPAEKQVARPWYIALILGLLKNLFILIAALVLGVMMVVITHYLGIGDVGYTVQVP